MNTLLILATTLITLALVFYSLGIWSERFAKYLKGWHVVAFWSGFLFDVSGTFTMHVLSDGHNSSIAHTITGQIALWLMFAHALWATWVILKGSNSMRLKFHSYSIFVWIIWLIPYFGGMYLGMSK
ncbi:MAG: TIGR03987 family protein [Bacteroidetes bacterium]|nr:MAG: TIGR03987 family protein [Bacteroidota bacterium]